MSVSCWLNRCVDEVALAISVAALFVALAALRAARRPSNPMDALQHPPSTPARWTRDETEPDPYREPGEALAVVLVATGRRKIQVIKAVRDATGISLKEARDLVEAQIPVTVAEGLPPERAQALVTALESAGATAELS
jgi:ribosomal protein L7/L12